MYFTTTCNAACAFNATVVHAHAYNHYNGTNLKVFTGSY